MCVRHTARYGIPLYTWIPPKAGRTWRDPDTDIEADPASSHVDPRFQFGIPEARRWSLPADWISPAHLTGLRCFCLTRRCPVANQDTPYWVCDV